MSCCSAQFKTNFEVKYKSEAFYKGGQVQISSDGQSMFCKCDHQVKVISTDTGKLIQVIGKDEEEDEVICFSVAPDDQTVVVSYRNGLLKHLEYPSGEVIRTWKTIHKGPISCMKFDSTSTLLATGGSDSTIKIWDVVRQYCTHDLKGAQGVFSVVGFHPDIQRLLIFGSANDCYLRVWDLRTKKCVAAMEGHYSTITDFVFTPDGNKLLSSGRDKVVILWDITKYSSLKIIPTYEAVESLILLPSNKKFEHLRVEKDDLHFITAGNKGLLRVWNASLGSTVYSQEDVIAQIPAQLDDASLIITQAELVASLNRIAVVTYEHNIIFLNIEDLSIHKQLIGHNDKILDIKFVGPSDQYIAVATNSTAIKLYELATFNCQLLKGHTDIVLALDVFHSNPFLLASSSKDNTIRLWLMDRVTYQMSCIAVGIGHIRDVSCVAASRLTDCFVVSGSQDRCFKVWQVPTFDVDVKLHDIHNLKVNCTEIAHDKEISSVTVSPNDSLLATGSEDKTAKLWKTANGTFQGVFKGHRKGIWCVEFSPVDQVLATSSADTTIRIWNIVDFSCLKMFQGHESSVWKVLFASRGIQMLSSSSDGLMKLWTVKINECLKSFDEHSDEIRALHITRDESLVATGDSDSNLIIWKDITKEEKDSERQRNEDLVLQKQKISNYLHEKKYLKALGLTINLKQPFTALTIVKEILLASCGMEKLEECLAELKEDQISSLLKFAVEWNTNSKHCNVAQTILYIILNNYTPEQLLKMPNLKENIEGLLSYTECHSRRVDNLLRQVMFVEYTWNVMKLEDVPLQN